MRLKAFFTLLMAVAAVSAASARNPYLAHVLEFCQAPGQFVNELPLTDASTSEAELPALVEEQLVGSADDPAPGLVSLGSFGGYVTFSFDHPVVNVPGQYDFKVYGNAFRATSATASGSSEPGIVMVSRDDNRNGLPDDIWYQLAGSEYHNPTTFHGFEITYYRPSDAEADIAWTSNDPERPSGVVARNIFHKQSYWPEYIDAETLTFKGTKLPDNGHYEDGVFLLDIFPWGYVDNQPNDDCPGFDIGNAVDADGQPVALDCVDFIRVYTAMLQVGGQIGETSTEVAGAEDLHPEAEAALPLVVADDNAPDTLYDLYGRRVDTSRPLTKGIYVGPKGKVFIH